MVRLVNLRKGRGSFGEGRGREGRGAGFDRLLHSVFVVNNFDVILF